MRQLLAAVLIWIAIPVFATTDAWPALYEVIDVSADDALNIRSGPGAEFDIIGSFAYDETGIEVIRPDEEFEWGLVNIDEGTGWVSLNYVVPHQGQWDGLYPEFKWCGGTEPFWSLIRQDGRMTLQQIDADDVTVPIHWETSARNHTLRHAFRAEGMTGVISLQHCNDGMSDMEFGIELNLILDGEGALYQGCCSLAP